MSVPLLLLIIALVLDLIEQFNAKLRSPLVWAVLLVILALLWGQLGLTR